MSQQAAIQSPSHVLIRHLQALNYGTRCLCCRVLVCSPGRPGHREPYFAAIMLATCAPSPSFNFGCLRTKCTPRGAFIEKRLGAKFLGGFFRLRGSGGEFSNTRTHTRRDGREDECFHHYGIHRAADQQGLKKKREEV